MSPAELLPPTVPEVRRLRWRQRWAQRCHDRRRVAQPAQDVRL